ncbi:MAG: 50S ribosomal protein L10 [Actinomycetota bacterium]|nr:50S ribosomal protein L10 [Actinomycetota bacterium]
MLRQDKEQVVAELVERLRTSDTLIVADYRGLTMTDIDGVRTELLKHGARFSVVKNTLTRRAADAAGVEGLHEFLDGPTAIAFVGDGDMVAVAKTLNDTARQTKVLELKGGILEGRAITAAQVKDLAGLPPAEVLRSQVVGAVVGPLNAIVGLFAAPLRDLVGVIDARIAQLEEADPKAEGEHAPRAADAEPELEEGPPPEAAAEQAPRDEEQPEAPGSAEDQQTPSADSTESVVAGAEDEQTTTDEQEA